MAKLNKTANDYTRFSKTYLDYNESAGYYAQLNLPLTKKTVREVTAETLTLNVGAAGTIGKVSIANKAAILNSDGSLVGYYLTVSKNDSSFDMAVNTTLDQEVSFKKNLSEEEIFEGLANGEYAIDYVSGIIYYRKKDAGTTVDVDYKYWLVKVDLNISGVTVNADLDGVYNVTTNPTPDNTGIIVHQNAATPNNTNQIVRVTGGVSSDSIVSNQFFGADTRSKLYAKDLGTANDVELIIKDGSTWAITDKVMGVADANVKSEVEELKENLLEDKKAYDTIEMTYVVGGAADGETETVTYKDGVTTIYTKTMTYDIDGRLIKVERS